MINYELYCQIRQLHRERGLTVEQIVRELRLNRRTVVHWLKADAYHPRGKVRRPRKLDAWRGDVARMLEMHPYSCTQVFQHLKERGYTGGIVKDLVRELRPSRAPAFLTLNFAPGECAQVDWGSWGSVTVGTTRRRLSFFVMVLCYSRMLYVEFTLSQAMEHFLACHQRAFEYLQCVPAAVMVDNCKTAILQRPFFGPAVVNPRYLDFARHYGFEIKPCGVKKPHEKGRVENAVGYVQKNFLRGRATDPFSALNPAARLWMESTANVRLHGSTRQRPVDLFKVEKPYLKPLNPQPYDVGVVGDPTRASNQFRVRVDTNLYSVPAEYASAELSVRVYPERIVVYHQGKLVAEHLRSYDRHQDFENPEHVRELLRHRRKASEQRILMRFMTLSPRAEEYYRQLQDRRPNYRQHVIKIMALSEIYGEEKVARAIEDALSFQAFSSEYIANILSQQERQCPEPGALHLTRRSDLLEIETPQPDLSIYEPRNPQSKNEKP
jgi:transposase